MKGKIIEAWKGPGKKDGEIKESTRLSRDDGAIQKRDILKFL